MLGLPTWKTMSDRIIQALKDVQKNQSELARHVGVQSPSVNDWISGKTKTIKGQNLLRAAEFLGVNPLWLAEGKGPKSAASLKTVRYAIDEFAEDEVTNKKTTYLRNCRFMMSESLPARWLMSCNPETSRPI